MENTSWNRRFAAAADPLGLLVFLGAWLLFCIEPLTGKMITPILGGASEVWIVCLLFFQVVVLGGYLLTFVLSRFAQRTQLIAYIVLFAISLLWAHIPTTDGWTFGANIDPTWALLLALTAHLSVPCIVLSSISGTMQVWHAAAGAKDPYKLYSLSNLGSFGALLAYPTLIEPQLAVSSTLRVLEVLYFGLFALAVAASVIVWRKIGSATATASGEVGTTADAAAPLTRKQIIRWLFLSTLGSAGLLAFTSYITTDVAPVPLLWVLPLAIYLLTFVIAFGKSQIKTDLLVSAWIPVIIAEPLSTGISPAVVLTLNFIALFLLCMVSNAELAAAKPASRNLSAFYLAIAVGGALGGVLVALVAPLCFTFAGEKSVVILVFTVYQMFADIGSLSGRRLKIRIAVAVLMSLALCAYLMFPAPGIVHRERNFFGSVSVKHEDDMVTLYHGRVKHGQQYLDAAKATIDVYPYGPPAALIFAFLHDQYVNKPLDFGVIGLGAGSMAIEAHSGDHIDFYEIDPKMQTIAQNWFSYLSKSPAKVNIEIGDGRLLLRDSHKKFDAFCIDAFSGDAVPVHLLTVEAMRIYLEHLNQDGILFFHITNGYLDLAPVIGNVANVMHLPGCELICKNEIKYVALCRNSAIMDRLISFARKEGGRFSGTSVTALPTRSDQKVWTDDHSNLFSVLKWHN